MTERLTVDTINSDQLDALQMKAARMEHAVKEYAKLRVQLEDIKAERDEARQWARHGYEIGQRHCSWSDHGVAPAWLTEGWPPHIDSCEHLKHAAEFDEALSRVRVLHERWIKAGAPPLGTSINRWWDTRLAEQGAALKPKEV